MELTYLGHSCFLLDTGAHRLIFDPFLSGNPKATVAPDDITCDYVLVTHGHGDHMGDAVAIARNNDATIISNNEVAVYCGQQGVSVHPMHIGGAWNFPFGRVKLTIAHHGAGIETDDGLIYLGNPTGMLVTTGGRTIYHAGDTGLFLDMKLIGEMHPIDVALLPTGDNFTMGVDDAAKAVEFLQPKIAVPMHYGTFDLIDTDPLAFAEKAGVHGARIEVMPVDATITI